MKMDEEGRVVYQLKKAYQNGTTHLRFTQEEFVEKLIALVPTPRMNLIRYHGVLGTINTTGFCHFVIESLLIQSLIVLLFVVSSS